MVLTLIIIIIMLKEALHNPQNERYRSSKLVSKGRFGTLILKKFWK